MSEWWTYRLSDFLLFNARTYHRLFELYNAEVWPLHALALACGLGLLALSSMRALRDRAWAPGAACALLAACWLWVALDFLLARYATINWAAAWFAAAFVAEGALLLASAAFDRRLRWRAASDRSRRLGSGLLLFAVLVQPWIGALLGRPLTQAEWFGLAPDPTALGTLGLLLLLNRDPGPHRTPPVSTPAWWLWPIPLLWCVVSGATLWTMQATEAWLLPAAGLAASVVAWRAGAVARSA